MSESNPEISILILTRNGKRYIRELLEGVYAQETARAFEVIVVDTASTDGSAEIAKAFPVRFYEIQPEAFGHAKTRNYGVDLAKGKYVALLTQDATPAPGWLEALAGCLDEDENIAGAYSRQVPRDGCNPSLRFSMEREWPTGRAERVVNQIDDEEDYRRDPYKYTFFANTSSIIRKAVWERFPFQGAVGEDVDWAKRVLEAGYKTVYEPASRVLHSHETGLWERLRANFDHHRSVQKAIGQKGVPTFRRAAANVVAETRQNARYFSETGMKAGERKSAIARAVMWHAASNIGAWLGGNHEALPGFFKRALSKLPDQYKED